MDEEDVKEEGERGSERGRRKRKVKEEGERGSERGRRKD